MDGADLATTPAPAAHHASRPSLGFPLGTALLLIVIFCLSGIFSCCYHWEKLRSLRVGRTRRQQQQSSADTLEDGHLPQLPPPSPSSKLPPKDQENTQEKIQSLPVIMPGDKIPKFMARPCPCQLSLPAAGEMTISVTVAQTT
ncbi:hypothetical protein Cni_G10083 [Canna indica]|uniref:Hydroxyproline-rich glycoprotein family protein n=1 Tax=Canna indica TaxID=4628 RepID=A0AAQ3K755_9LILI|nr:hypothetical protein Cni_G10083 [Canna indica]